MVRSCSLIRVLTSLVVVGVLCACNNRANNNSPGIEGARALPGQFAAALNSASIDQLQRTLTDDAVLVRGNASPLTGRKAITDHYKEAFEQVRYEISFSSEALEPAGDLAVDRGKFAGTLKTVDGKTSVVVSGQYFHILKIDQEGGWSIWRGMWTFAQPIAATSCQDTGARSCCCTDIGGNDCIARPNEGCPSTHPIPILLP